MEQGKRYSGITDAQIRDAAEEFFQAAQLFHHSMEERRRKELEAATTLIDAGRKRIREVCKDRLETLHPGFWASKRELEITRNATILGLTEQEIAGTIPLLSTLALRYLLTYQQDKIRTNVKISPLYK